MADFEKMSDNELEEVSGGTKYFIGSTPVTVYNAPGGYPICTLYREKGDFFVTDGQSFWVGGTNWCHVYMSHGEGYVDSCVL